MRKTFGLKSFGQKSQISGRQMPSHRYICMYICVLPCCTLQISATFLFSVNNFHFSDEKVQPRTKWDMPIFWDGNNVHFFPAFSKLQRRFRYDATQIGNSIVNFRPLTQKLPFLLYVCMYVRQASLSYVHNSIFLYSKNVADRQIHFLRRQAFGAGWPDPLVKNRSKSDTLKKLIFQWKKGYFSLIT
jgi:hypothetical protein